MEKIISIILDTHTSEEMDFQKVIQSNNEISLPKFIKNLTFPMSGSTNLRPSEDELMKERNLLPSNERVIIEELDKLCTEASSGEPIFTVGALVACSNIGLVGNSFSILINSFHNHLDKYKPEYIHEGLYSITALGIINNILLRDSLPYADIKYGSLVSVANFMTAFARHQRITEHIISTFIPVYGEKRILMELETSENDKNLKYLAQIQVALESCGFGNAEITKKLCNIPTDDGSELFIIQSLRENNNLDASQVAELFCTKFKTSVCRRIDDILEVELGRIETLNVLKEILPKNLKIIVNSDLKVI